ncbi:MAG: hypothetical protein ACUZ8H_06380 [Candidatus Anammoxibacter sp.]
MAHAYTPGLKVSEKTTVLKKRTLPLLGNVLVKKGDIVRSDMIVAKTELPGKVHSINVINKLGISPGRINEYMLKKKGDSVTVDEPLAESKPWLKFLKVNCKSTINGTVENISTITGQVLLREEPRPVQINAFIDGRVVETIEKEGVTIETTATFIQGIFGIGGETTGELVIPVKNPDSVLAETDIDESFKEKIVVAGAFIDYKTLKKAIEVGVKGVIVGGFDDETLKEILGYDIGVAITGAETIGITIIITEGFGRIEIAQKTFDLLKSRSGAKTSINGATQIRAGVVRPEVVIPYQGETGVGSASDTKDEEAEKEQTGIKIGDPVRIIRNPLFGKIGIVNDLPADPKIIETGSKLRILEVKFPDGAVSTIPRSNVEAIEQ